MQLIKCQLLISCSQPLVAITLSYVQWFDCLQHMSTYQFVINLLFLAQYPQGSIMLWCMSECLSFLNLNTFWMRRLPFMYPLMCRWALGCFYLLAAVNNDMNTGLSIYHPNLIFSSLGYMSICANVLSFCLRTFLAVLHCSWCEWIETRIETLPALLPLHQQVATHLLRVTSNR